MDYRVYYLTVKERLECVAYTLIIGGIISYLFYNSPWGLVLTPILYLVLTKRKKNEGRDNVQKELAREFLDALRSVSASLLAGFSMENAWREAQREMERAYGKDSMLSMELEQINHSVGYNTPLEQLLSNFAERSGNADISSFAEVFAFAKRSGGNFATIIEGTAEHMRVRNETEREIQVLVASRKMEQKVMNGMPILILAYLKVSSAGFLDILYKNPAGVIFMTVSLLAYVGAMVLADKILDIRM